MKKFWISLGIIILLFAWHIVPARAVENDRIGILDFSGADDPEYCIRAANRLTSILSHFGKYEIVERAEMDRILKEQEFQESGAVDQETALEAGRIAGITTAYLGNIDQLSATYDKDLKEYTATAKVTIKIISVDTAEILSVIQASAVSTNGGEKESLHAALDKCFGYRFQAQLREFLAPYSSIQSISGDTIYFENGKNVGVKPGLRYRILRPLTNFSGDNAAAPDTVFARQVGLVEVEQVIEARSQAKIIWNSEAVLTTDLLQEEMVKWELISFNLQSLPTNLGNPLMLEGGYGVEIPFKGFTRGNYALGVVNGIVIAQTGVEWGSEIPLKSGTLYFFPFGGLGGSVALQNCEYSGSSELAFAKGLYATGGLGLKYYLHHEHGARIELAAVGQLGPANYSWEGFDDDENTIDLTDWVPYSRFVGRGLTLRITVSIPLTGQTPTSRGFSAFDDELTDGSY